MSSVLSLLLAEGRKLARLKLPYLGLAAFVLMAIIWPQTLQYYTDTATPMTGYEFVANAMISISTLLIPIFVSIFAATLIASETASGTIRHVLCRPVTRGAFLCAKFLAGFAYAGLMVALGAVVVAAVGAVAIGFGTERDLMLGVDVRGGEFWAEYCRACVFALAPAFATAAFGLFVSVLFRGAGAAVGAAVGLIVILEPMKAKVQWGAFELKDWVWTHYYDTALDLAKRLAEGTPDLWNTPEIWRAVIVPFGWIVLFTGASWWIFSRRDIN